MGAETETKHRGLLHNMMVWSYERGTLQYDIICALILAFVFFVPQSCFVRGVEEPHSVSQSAQASVSNLSNHPVSAAKGY